jgi:hypothetical protein
LFSLNKNPDLIMRCRALKYGASFLILLMDKRGGVARAK